MLRPDRDNKGKPIMNEDCRIYRNETEEVSIIIPMEQYKQLIRTIEEQSKTISKMVNKGELEYSYAKEMLRGDNND